MEPQPSVGGVLVPSFVGMLVDDARSLATSRDLLLTTGNLDGPPLGSLTWPGVWTVIAQTPDAGVVVERCSWVVIDVMNFGGGDSGDREPRTPNPPSSALSVGVDLPDFEEQRRDPEGHRPS